MSDYDLINGEILTVSVTVDEEVITAEINTAARGPAGPAGSGTSSVTSATTSDGTAALYLDSIRFEATNGGPTQLGQMAWESTDGSIDAMLESGVIVAMGEDLVIRVRNTTASPITKGTALAYDGTSGASGRIEVKPWVGANIPTAKLFLGFAACDIPANSNGYSQWFGKLAEINTSGGAQTWLDEQIIYAVPGASATLTNIAPTSGEYAAAAVVINAGSGTSGILFVRPTFENITSLISLGAGATGSELFGAADAAAANLTLGTIRGAASSDVTATTQNVWVSTGASVDLTVGTWRVMAFYHGANAGSSATNVRLSATANWTDTNGRRIATLTGSALTAGPTYATGGTSSAANFGTAGLVAGEIAAIVKMTGSGTLSMEVTNTAATGTATSYAGNHIIASKIA